MKNLKFFGLALAFAFSISLTSCGGAKADKAEATPEATIENSDSKPSEEVVVDSSKVEADSVQVEADSTEAVKDTTTVE